MRRKNSTYTAFSIIEVMVGIFIFSLGLISIYALLVSSLRVSDYNKNAIIAGNLAREQIELVRNMRDTNYKKLQIWKQLNPVETYSASTQILWDTMSLSGSYYIVENDFDLSAPFTTRFDDITSTFVEWQHVLTDPWMKQYQVCEDLINWRYVDCPDSIDTSLYKETYFYKYLQVQEAKDIAWNVIPDSFLLISKVIWYKRGYHEFDIKTLITDWRRI